MNKSQFKKLMSRIRYNATDFGEKGIYCKVEYIENYLKDELEVEGEEEKKEPPLEKFCRMAYPCKLLEEEKCTGYLSDKEHDRWHDPPFFSKCVEENSDIEQVINATGKRMTAEDLEKAFQWFQENDPRHEKGWEMKFATSGPEADKLLDAGWEPFSAVISPREIGSCVATVQSVVS